MTGPRTWRLDLPIVKPLSMNDRRHFMAHAREVRTIRNLAKLACRLAAIPPLARCEVAMHFVPRDRRRRDADNLMATAKPCFDGCVDAGIVEDDTPDLMVKPQVVIDLPNSKSIRSRVYLIVTELDAVAL